jgi:hypothetical protein
MPYNDNIPFLLGVVGACNSFNTVASASINAINNAINKERSEPESVF